MPPPPPPERDRALVIDVDLARGAALAGHLAATGLRATALGATALGIDPSLGRDHDLVVASDAPGRRGSVLALVRTLRTHFDPSQLPILAITDDPRAATVAAVLDAGADACVTRPYELPVLAARARALLRHKSLHDARELVMRMASHDLKNPITGILGCARLLEELLDAGDTSPHAHRELVSSIAASSLQMHRVVRDLVDTRAIGVGAVPVDRRPTDVNAIAGRVHAANLGPASAKGIRLDLVLGATRACALADPDRLSQVLDNLVSNAIKFSPPGTATRVVTRAAGDRLAIDVVDAGPGLGDADVTRLLRHYGRGAARPTAGESSTGLGLALSSRLVTLIGGELGARNNVPGPGATFSVSLPASRATA